MQNTALLAAAAWAPEIFAQSSGDYWSQPRMLWLKRKETGEEVRTVYWADGRLVVDAYVQCCTLLRDVRADATVQMNQRSSTFCAVSTGGLRKLEWRGRSS